MAQVERIVLVDDMDGSDITETGSNIPFSLDGKTYEIDLGPGNAAKLREVLEPYIAVGRRTGKVGSKKAAGSPPFLQIVGSNKAIRDWARQHGHQVADRGRIPAKVQQAYQASRLRSVS